MSEILRIHKTEISDKECKVFYANSQSIAVYRDGESYHAFENSCPHKQLELEKGMIKDGVITCPWHRFRYDLQTGQSLTNRQLKLHIYQAVVDGNDLVIGNKK
jgi:nitrite reductase (NADH) small subunit